MRTGSKDPELLQQASQIALAMGNVDESKKLITEAKKVNPLTVL